MDRIRKKQRERKREGWGKGERNRERERHAHYAPHSLLSHKFKPVACNREIREEESVHMVESSLNSDSIDAPVIARTVNPDATRNLLNRLSRPRGEPSELLAPSRSICDVVASWSNGGRSAESTRRGKTVEEAELSLFATDKILNKFFM